MQDLEPVISFWSTTHLPQWNNFLRVIMTIANKKPTAASPHIMPAPLSIKNTSIKIKGLLFAFLKAKNEVPRKHSNTFCSFTWK